MVQRIESFSEGEKCAYVNFAFVNVGKLRIRYVK